MLWLHQELILLTYKQIMISNRAWPRPHQFPNQKKEMHFPKSHSSTKMETKRLTAIPTSKVKAPKTHHLFSFKVLTAKEKPLTSAKTPTLSLIEPLVSLMESVVGMTTASVLINSPCNWWPTQSQLLKDASEELWLENLLGKNTSQPNRAEEWKEVDPSWAWITLISKSRTRRTKRVKIKVLNLETQAVSTRRDLTIILRNFQNLKKAIVMTVWSKEREL